MSQLELDKGEERGEERRKRRVGARQTTGRMPTLLGIAYWWRKSSFLWPCTVLLRQLPNHTFFRQGASRALALKKSYKAFSCALGYTNELWTALCAFPNPPWLLHLTPCNTKKTRHLWMSLSMWSPLARSSKYATRSTAIFKQRIEKSGCSVMHSSKCNAWASSPSSVQHRHSLSVKFARTSQRLQSHLKEIARKHSKHDRSIRGAQSVVFS